MRKAMSWAVILTALVMLLRLKEIVKLTLTRADTISTRADVTNTNPNDGD